MPPGCTTNPVPQTDPHPDPDMETYRGETASVHPDMSPCRGEKRRGESVGVSERTSEAELLAGGALDVAAELLAHRGDQLAAVVTLAARAEAFVQRRAQHVGRDALVDGGQHRPAPLAGIGDPPAEFG